MIILNLITFFFNDMSPIGQIEQMMAFRQYWDAYQELTQMIDQSHNKKSEVKLYRMRAECCLNMLMLKECIQDCKLGLELKPNLHEKKLLKTIKSQAHLHLGEADLAELESRSINHQELIQQSQELKKLLI